MSFFRRIFGEAKQREPLQPLYRAVVAKGREPAWYREGQVPDTLEQLEWVALVASGDRLVLGLVQDHFHLAIRFRMSRQMPSPVISVWVVVGVSAILVQGRHHDLCCRIWQAIALL